MTQYTPGRFQILPPIVKNLLIINVIFFVATFLAQRFNLDLNDKLGLHYFGSQKFQPFQIITYMFMHGGFGHIFFNMFALWMFGYAIENYMGPKRFLIYYLTTGIGAAILHYGVFYLEIRPLLDPINQYLSDPENVDKQHRLINVLNPIVSQPISINDLNYDLIETFKIDFLNRPVVVGASGAVFGILLAFGMMFPNSIIYLYFAIPVKAKYFVIIYGLLELWLGFSNRGGSNIAHFAHIGGMIFGFILLKYWNIKRLN
ncbi:MAG: rhomboid family intramembrane serine protease [Bacteroidetes bacterium]|nr:rhomboid family intramembrane serine protease [Bacteroidota bacterium]